MFPMIPMLNSMVQAHATSFSVMVIPIISMVLMVVAMDTSAVLDQQLHVGWIRPGWQVSRYSYLRVCLVVASFPQFVVPVRVDGFL